MLDSGRVAAKPVTQESRNPADRGDADSRQVVNPAVGEVFLQKADDLPAIDECLQLRRRA